METHGDETQQESVPTTAVVGSAQGPARNTQNAAPPTRFYYPGLDGLRALAFALVFFFHDKHVLFLDRLVDHLVLPLALLVDPLLRMVGLPEISFRFDGLLTQSLKTNGWIGVQLFFVLSGFLIGSLLIRERERFGMIDLRAFWVRRILRIWPLYYLAVIIGFGILPLTSLAHPPGGQLALIERQLPAFLFFLGNWSMGSGPPIGVDALSVLWSVCVEEQFYLFVPLLIALIRPRWQIPAVLSLMALGIVTRYHLVSSGVDPRSTWYRYHTLVNLDTLLAGVLLALLTKGEMNWLKGIWRSALSWLVLVFGIGLLSMGVIGAPPYTEKLGRGGPWTQVLNYILIWSWGLGLIVMAAAPSNRFWRLFSWRPIVWLGKISYGLYVYHMIALELTKWIFEQLPNFTDKALLRALVGPLVTVSMAALSYYGFERPFLSLKSRWTRVPSRPTGESRSRSIGTNSKTT